VETRACSEWRYPEALVINQAVRKQSGPNIN
jgi:hypothetical protein